MEQAKWDSSSLPDGRQIKDNKGNKQRTQAQENGCSQWLFKVSMKHLWDVRRDPLSLYRSDG